VTKRVRLSAIPVLLALSLVSTRATAQTVDDATRASAREIGTAGVEAFQAGDYEAASEKLEKAYRVLKAPTLGLWSARALVKQRRLVQAAERYLEVTRLTPSSGDMKVQKQALADAEEELAELRPTIPAVVIELVGASPAEVVITVDGASMPSDLVGENRRIDPGIHRVEATRGRQKLTEEFSVKEGETKTLKLRFTQGDATAPGTPEPIPADRSPSPTDPGAGRGSGALPVVGLVAAGVGVAAIGVGSFFGLRAKSLDDDSNADGRCTNGCDKTGTRLRNDAGSAADLATVFFITGGVLAAGGLTLYFVGDASESSTAAHLSPALDRTGAGLSVGGVF
jgi:hypothetical protein